MSKIISFSSLLLTLFMVTSFNCRKNPVAAEFYYQCLVDGQLYIPNSCANCNHCDILGDTTFILGANRDFESVILGIHDSAKISAKTYVLDNPFNRRGVYDNSTDVDDIFETNGENTGELIIKSIDKTKKIIEGTFYFKAYNPVQDKVVHVTQGKFRLEYLYY